MKIKLFYLFIIFAVLLLHKPVQSRELVNVCILPFEEYSIEKDSTLQDSVLQELEKQLSLNPYFIICDSRQVQQVLNKLGSEVLTEPNLKDIAKNLGANFIVTGSITKIKNDMSIDVEVFNDFHPVTYFKTFADGTDLGRMVEDISRNIVRDIMEKEPFIPPSKRPEGGITEPVPDDTDRDLDYYLDNILDEGEPDEIYAPEPLQHRSSPSPSEPITEQDIEADVPFVEGVAEEDESVSIVEDRTGDVVFPEPEISEPEPQDTERELAEVEKDYKKEETADEKTVADIRQPLPAVDESVKVSKQKKTGKKEEKDKLDFASSDQPINISSDSLEYDNKANRASFKGNVVARQGDMVIFAKTMEVSYSTDGGIKEAKAAGSVRVVQGDRIATGDTIVFNNTEQKIVATGNARVWQGDNVIQGRTITVYLREDRAVVEGGPEGRVSATVVPGSEKD